MAMTKEDVAEAVRAWCHAWHTRDVQTILAMEARAVGFGFRPFVGRDHVARGEAQDRQELERFFGRNHLPGSARERPNHHDGMARNCSGTGETHSPTQGPAHVCVAGSMRQHYGIGCPTL